MFHFFRVSKNLDKRRRVSSSFVERLLSHSAEIYVGDPFNVSSNSGIEKVWIRGGEYQDFPSDIICLTVPRTFVRESFIVLLFSGIEKTFASEAYVTIFDFLSKSFCLTVPKFFVGEPF